MDVATGVASFVDKWHVRWPEWNVGGVFLPATQRELAFAWFALLQELTDAAWSGSDATPGLAKLAWWNEELQGWAKGARRHPLGERLQAQPAPWMSLAAGLRGLQASRELPPDADPAHSGLEPFAQALAQCERRLFDPDEGGAGDAGSVMSELWAERLLLRGDADNARTLLEAWPGRTGVRARRVHSAFVRQRLRCLAGDAPNRTSAPWRSLWLAWRAARTAG
jgi:phytoene/squalene synthetase